MLTRPFILMNDNIYELQFTVSSLRMLHKAVTFAHKHWPGGDPVEQEYYLYLKDSLQRVLLEETFMLDAWRLSMERDLGHWRNPMKVRLVYRGVAYYTTR